MTQPLRLLVLIAAIALVAPVAAQPPTTLERRLQQGVTLTFQGQLLGPALARLGETQDVPLWIDRRVDPGAPVNLAANDQPLFDVLNALAAERGYAATPFRGVVYFGPRATADALAALSTRARGALARTPQAVRRRWLTPAPWSFPRLSEPRQLLHEVLQSVGAESANESHVPHDLWPAASVPSMAPVDQALLLLAGFDLTLEISVGGRRAAVVPIDYAALPAAKATAERPGGAQRARPAPSAPADKLPSLVFTLKVDNRPVGPVIDQLAQQLELQVTWEAGPDEEPGKLAEILVSCDVRNASIDELLGAVLTPAGLAYERNGAAVTVRRGP